MSEAPAVQATPTIGLEVHVELSTRTKMFCSCANAAGGEPNTRVCPVCLGLPGSLPVPNREAVAAAIRLGLAVGSTIAPSSHFHRKHYFYPDMPKNYQISQYDQPICSGGEIATPLADGSEPTVRLERIHMEEDTGKSIHVGGSGRIHGAAYSLEDYNRAGVPLLEVVSRPDITSAEQARAYLAELRALVLALGISDAKLEEGSLRCDANVSVRLDDGRAGEKVEVKNMNSLRSLHDAVAHEIARQTEVLADGGEVVQQTRHWDEQAGRTRTLRIKEQVVEYRYFPDPDLVAVEPDRDWIDRLATTLPELPAAARRRLLDAGLEATTVRTLLDQGLVGLHDDAVAAGAPADQAAKWLTNDHLGLCAERDLDPAAGPLDGAGLAELCAMVDDGRLSTKMAREVLAAVLDGEGGPEQVAEARGLEQITDESALLAAVEQAIADDAEAAEKVRDGNAKAVGPLVGKVMKATGGQADPKRVNELLLERLQGG